MYHTRSRSCAWKRDRWSHQSSSKAVKTQDVLKCFKTNRQLVKIRATPKWLFYFDSTKNCTLLGFCKYTVIEEPEENEISIDLRNIRGDSCFDRNARSQRLECFYMLRPKLRARAELVRLDHINKFCSITLVFVHQFTSMSSSINAINVSSLN